MYRQQVLAAGEEVQRLGVWEADRLHVDAALLEAAVGVAPRGRVWGLDARVLLADLRRQQRGR